MPRSLATIPPLVPGHLAVVTLDALVSGVHFPPGTGPANVAWKAVTVNLSDLAAMGADAIALQAHVEAPAGDDAWQRAVGDGLADSARAFSVALHRACARGPERRVSVQAIGQVPRGAQLTRGGARAGDRVWVSGTLGDAGAGLALAQGRLTVASSGDGDCLLERHARPWPRLALGRALRGVASAAIDISDGIAGDAGHVARASGVGIRLQACRLPMSPALTRCVGEDAARELALYAGDDYELMFCVPPRRTDAVLDAARQARCAVCVVGEVTAGNGVTVLDADGRPLTGGRAYQHFAEPEA